MALNHMKGATDIIYHHFISAHDAATSHLSKIDPVLLVVGTVAGTVVFLKLRKIIRASEKPVYKRLLAYAFQQLRRLPAVKARIEKELGGAKVDILETIHKDDSDRQFHDYLPSTGMSHKELVELAKKYDGYGKFAVGEGRVSGAVYTDISDQHVALLADIYRMYAFSNPLHPDVFPGVRKMEAEVIRMVLSLYHAPESARGSLTTGGTESIILACFAYRNAAKERGIEDPVIVCPVTAHAAFDKAADLCGMRIRHVAVDENNRVDLKAMTRAICSDTCMLVGSAPNFPTGSVDPIREIAELGQKYNIGVHVDACLGGFLVPFMAEAGYYIGQFDFRLPGVTSISCDTHKYGCTPKGSSIVMYRSEDLHHHQYFSVPEWCGGIYATPTICGSRAGASTAATWATLLWMGRDEYVERARAIVSATRRLAEGAKSIPGLEIFGTAEVSVVALKSSRFNIYAVGDRLTKKGYALNTLQNPDSIHVCLTFNHAKTENVDKLLELLTVICAEVDALPDKGKNSKTAALYGLAAQVPDKTLVNEMAFTFLDACYAKPPPKH